MSISESLLETAKVTNGRLDAQRVFRDFLAYCAYLLSNSVDPVHQSSRQKQLETVLGNYKPHEKKCFEQTFQLMVDEAGKNLLRSDYIDFLGPVYKKLHPKSGPFKQDFSSPGIGKIISKIVLKNAELSKKGYFISTEPTCGSGVLCLALAEEIANRGYNPCEQMVIQASDMDSRCVHMTYIQLALYGIPAVIIQGDVITLTEYDRWYTPFYLLRDWVWRAPMPFRPGRNKSDELLKMLSEPWYAKARYLDAFIREKESGKEIDHE